jgi:hypothetical protein
MGIIHDILGTDKYCMFSNDTCISSKKRRFEFMEACTIHMLQARRLRV